MSTAHTFDYPANWLLLPSPKGDAGQRRQFLQMSKKTGPMFDVSNYHSFTSDDNLPPRAKLRFKFSIEQNALITHSLL
jgi:hypothetical protein